MLTEKEIQAARDCIRHAMANGADGARATLNKCVTDGCSMFNGSIDKVTHSADRSIYIYLFVDGRYGTFSTNRLDIQELDSFVANAINMVRMLGEDLCRKLPDKNRTASDATSGLLVENVPYFPSANTYRYRDLSAECVTLSTSPFSKVTESLTHLFNETRAASAPMPMAMSMH